MTELPVVGDSENSWGDKLNTFLSKYPFYNVKASYGAVGDGSTDDTAAIAAALSAANAAGGGTVYFPPGVYVTGTQNLYTGVHILGAGIATTTIRLKSGTNADLLHAYTANINLSSSFGGGSDTGVYNFSIQDISLDGNKANQSSGTSYPLRLYGRGYTFHNLRIINGYTGGYQCDWNPPDEVLPSDHERGTKISNLLVTDCNGIGWEWGGGFDSQWVNGVVSNSAICNIHIGLHAGGTDVCNFHTWGQGTGTTTGWIIESDSCVFQNIKAESAGALNVLLLGDNHTFIGQIFAGNLGSSAGGIQLGQQAGQTPYAGQLRVSSGTTTANAPVGCMIHATFHDIGSSQGCINFANDGGANDITAVCNLPSGGLIYTGTPFASADKLHFQAVGPTRDGSLAKNGGFSIGISSTKAFRIREDVNFTDILNIDTYSSPAIMALLGVLKTLSPSGAHNVQISHDNTNAIISTDTGDIRLSPGSGGSVALYNSNGQVFTIDQYGNLYINGGFNTSTGLYFVASSTPASLSSSGTISALGLPNKVVAPSTDVSSVILQAGYGGQFLCLVNKSAFSIQFDASGTSHVANGKAEVIPPNSMRIYHYNAGDSLWYGVSSVGEESASAAATATNGTITTAGVEEARVAPTGNITGVILQAGTYANQQCCVVNESAFTVTMAASGTSNVADGVSAVITANRCMFFVWDSGTSLWYHS
jgi:hypothetical protein